MFRNCLTAMLTVICAAAVVSAADYAGKITKFDSATRKVTVHVDDKDQTFDLAKDCKFYKWKGTAKKGGYDEDPKGVKDVVAGAAAELSTDFVDGNEVVTMLKVKSKRRKKN